jgi:hypothetical protein
MRKVGSCSWTALEDKTTVDVLYGYHAVTGSGNLLYVDEPNIHTRQEDQNCNHNHGELETMLYVLLPQDGRHTGGDGD